MEDQLVHITPEDFPSKLRELRKKKGLSQTELASQANVSQQAISAMEKGRHDPSLGTVITIAVILGVALLIGTIAKKEGNSS